MVGIRRILCHPRWQAESTKRSVVLPKPWVLEHVLELFSDASAAGAAET
jgi:hypothetical protein